MLVLIVALAVSSLLVKDKHQEPVKYYYLLENENRQVNISIYSKGTVRVLVKPFSAFVSIFILVSFKVSLPQPTTNNIHGGQL